VRSCDHHKQLVSGTRRGSSTVEPSPHELLLNLWHGEIVFFVQVDENSVECSIYVSILHLRPCRKIFDDRKAIVVYQTAIRRPVRPPQRAREVKDLLRKESRYNPVALSKSSSKVPGSSVRASYGSGAGMSMEQGTSAYYPP
jgi:hypothetical protein